MKCGIIFFSGTGNSEYIAKRFKSEFQEYDIECDLIDTSTINKLMLNYDYYVFGGPIHAEGYPKYFTKWIDNNISTISTKRTIIFSTQASENGAAPNVLAHRLSKKGFQIDIIKPIPMPNNYYTVMFERSSDSEIASLKENADKTVEELVEKFMNMEKVIDSCSKQREIGGKLLYELFYQYSKGWANRTFTVDMTKCTQCKKCIQKCPSANIILENEKIKFLNKCLSCQRCLNLCPVNAYKYKGKNVQQYKL